MNHVAPETLRESLIQKLSVCLAAMPHRRCRCIIMGSVDCADGKVPCIKVCCIWTCYNCLVTALVSNGLVFKCSCRKSSPVDSIITHPSVIPLFAWYRAIDELDDHPNAHYYPHRVVKVKSGGGSPWSGRWKMKVRAKE